MKNITAGVDPGNKNLKVYVEGMKKPLIIENATYDVTLINAQSDLNTNTLSAIGLFKKKQQDPIDLLDLSIKSGSMMKRKYLGSLALKHGGELRSSRKTKSNDEDILFAMLGGLAFTMVEVGKEISKSVNLSTCLPVSEYIHKHNFMEHEKRLIGKHEITFNNPYFESAKVTIEISKDDLLIIPEGTAALLNIVTDEKGEIQKEYEKIEDRIFIVVDIGAGTTDIIAIKDYEPVEELMSFIDRGIFLAIDRVIETLKRIRPDYSITKSDLDYYVREKGAKLIDGEETWDVSKYTHNEFASLTKELSNKINDLIQKIPANFRNYIARIILTGGASQILSNYFSAEELQTKIVLSNTCIFDNVMGCYKAMEKTSSSNNKKPKNEEQKDQKEQKENTNKKD